MMRGWKSRAFSRHARNLLAGTSIAALLAFSSQAAAQSVLTAPPPTHYSLDPRGVDVITGKFTLATVDASIGDPGAGGLAYVRTYIGGGWRDSITGAVNPYSGGVTVSIGGQSEEFSQIGSTFTALAGTGSTLTKASNLYTYKTASGLTAIFSMEFSSYTGQAAGYGIISLTRPSGDSLTYNYTKVTVPKTPGGIPVVTVSRLQSVVSNSGYQIELSYLVDDPYTTANLNQFLRQTGVTASNRTTTEIRAWPYATYASGAVNRSGITTNYAFSANGPTAIRRPTSTVDDIIITYDGSGRVSTWADNGNTWTYGYALSGTTLTTTVTNPLGKAETYVSNTATNRLTSYKDALNNTTSYQYDSYGRLTRATRPEGDYTQYAYDTRGNVTSTTHVPKAGSGLANIATSAVYPATCANPATCNQPTSTTDARGAVTDYTYASHGGVLTVTEPAPTSGAVRPQTRYIYDSLYAWYRNNLGVMAQAPTPVVRVTQIAQCATTATCVGTADEVKTTIGYGATGTPSNREPVQVTQGSGDGALTATTTVAYTLDGDIKSVDGPLSGTDDVTTYRYDSVRRPVGIIGPDPDGAGPLKRRAVRNSFNQDGQVTLTEQGVVDGLSDPNWAAFASLQQVGTTFDTWGRPVMVEAMGGGVVHGLQQTSYDVAGRVDCVATRMNPAIFGTPPSSVCAQGTAGSYGPDRIVRMTYDDAGRPLSTISGVGTSSTLTESVSYTANGQPATLTDANGNVSTLVRDGFDRVTRLRYPNASGGGSSTTDYENYTYDPASNVTVYRNRGGDSFTTTYDALNRPTLVDAPSGTNDVGYTYDNLGRTQTAVAGGQTLTYTWDALGRRTSEVGPLGTTASQYDLAGRRTRLTWPGTPAFHVQYDYDLYGAMTKVRENGATSGAGVLATYAYDNLGRRASVARGNGATTSYAYDGGSRLTQLRQDLPGTTQDLQLDFTYNPASQILTRTVSNPAYAFSPTAGSTAYANNGRNQVTSVGGTSVTYDGRQNITGAPSGGYGYNGLNELVSATVGGTTSNLDYDPSGRLYQASNSGSTRRFLYDGLQAVAEYDGAGALIQRFVPGLGLDDTVAAYDGSGVGSRNWLLADERGSIVALTDGAGAATAINTYDEYGVPGAGNQGRFQYTGQMWLSAAKLYHYKARAYAPDLGRFMQSDPIGYAAGANLYAYVGADPVNYTDPLGLMEVIWRPCTRPVTMTSDVGLIEGVLYTQCPTWIDLPTGGGRGGIGRHFAGAEWGRGSASAELRQAQAEFVQQYRNPALERNAWMVDVAMAPWMVVEAPFVLGARAPGIIARTCKCFVEGTGIQTPDGARPIEKLAVGDLVLARDEETGETAYKPIRALVRNEEREIWEVTVETTDAAGRVQRETIGTTDEHPWRLASGEWSETYDLHPGAELVTSDGDRVVVLSALKTDRIEPTYNFEVGDFHTYFVGESGIWVHNACFGRIAERLFGRHGQGILNRNDYLRIGWGPGKDATRQNFYEQFRIAIGNRNKPVHWHIDLPFKR